MDDAHTFTLNLEPENKVNNGVTEMKTSFLSIIAALDRAVEDPEHPSRLQQRLSGETRSR